MLDNIISKVKNAFDELKEKTEQEKSADILLAYKRNAVGDLVAIENIKELVLIEDALTDEIVNEAIELQIRMAAFKNKCIDKMGEFVELSMDEYGAKSAMGKKGNLTLRTFDGSYSVSIKVQNKLGFDSKLDIAKGMIDECARKWAEGSRPEIKTIIAQAFQTDKRGNINREKVFELLRWDIKDPDWLRAMEALKDSIFHESSKEYFQISRRVSDKENKMVQLSLNLSTL